MGQFSMEISGHAGSVLSGNQQSRLMRPLTWLGMIELHPDTERYGSIYDRRYRKTPLFGRFLHFNFTRATSGTVH